MNYWVILVPVLTAFTGWLVTWLAVKMLFHPQQPKKIIGFTIQGLFPAQQKNIAQKAGEYAQAELSSFSGLQQKLSDPQHFEKLKPVIEKHIDDFLTNKLPVQMPMIGMFIGEKTIATLKTIFIAEIETMFPEVLGQFAGDLTHDINIGKLVSAKIEAISPIQLEKVMQQTLSKKIQLLTFCGAFIGLLIGLVQVLILFFTK